MTVAAGGQPEVRVLRSPSGEPIFNSFPIRYYEPEPSASRARTQGRQSGHPGS